MKYIYEITDLTNDDRIYPLGVFESLYDAVTAIKQIEAEGKSISNNESWETITVYQRTMGWSDMGTPIMTISREEYLDDATGEYRWRRIRG
jgi:hypothetical protein